MNSGAESNDLRQITISLPEPWSLNNLLRQSYHFRNSRREMLKKELLKHFQAYGWLIHEKKPLKHALTGEVWQPMKFVRVDAHLTLSALRDDFELPACLKIELDAAQEVKLIASDGPKNLVRGDVTQSTGTPRGVTIRFTELESAPERRQRAL